MSLRLTAALKKQLDQWRRNQHDLPNRSEAVRRILEQAFGS